VTDRIDTMGAKVVDEIDQVMAMIEATSGSVTSYSESLADASRKLGAADREGLRAMIESLVVTTKEVKEANQSLEARLKASKDEILQLQHNLEALRHESLTDPLTALANRKSFDLAIEKAIANALKSREPLSRLMIDIDHFKKLNDTFGHLTGDQVLRLVARVFKHNVKDQDVAARYGGEEFAVMLPRTGLQQAHTVGDNIRRAVMGKELIKRLDRRAPWPHNDFGRGCELARRRCRAIVHRPRRRGPLRRQAQRPQSRRLRSGWGIRSDCSEIVIT
jgi:diguanylate cyclase